MNGKLVQTSMGCVGVSKETVVNLEISWVGVYCNQDGSGVDDDQILVIMT